jgi:radical SAM enzyme (TIGR01210 family)
VPAVSATEWIRGLRPAKKDLDPFRPIAHFWETERLPAGGKSAGEIAALTVLLAGAECPFTCVFCDLWRETLEGPTPPGALPAQLRAVLADLTETSPLPQPSAIKLYNASNFFEPRAVPVEDEEEILGLLAPFSRVTVECHPRLVGRRCLAFAERLSGRLEVAMGLETIHPEALAQLNKGMTLPDFDRAAATLRGAEIGLRAFVLVGAPFVPAEEAVEWAVRSAEHAFAVGAERVSLIPVRAGNGAMEDLREAGEWSAPALDHLEEALERCLDAEGTGIVTTDLWDARRFAACPTCAEERLARLARMNASGRNEPRVPCPLCGWS